MQRPQDIVRLIQGSTLRRERRMKKAPAKKATKKTKKK
jgi:hypothetical protein